MKLKEFGPRGEEASKILLCGSATDIHGVVYHSFAYVLLYIISRTEITCFSHPMHHNDTDSIFP